MKVYLTLFNEAYMAKGLALYRSLERYHKHDDFILIIKPIGEYTTRKLYALNLKKALIWDWNGFDELLFNGLETKHGRPNVFWALASQYLAIAHGSFSASTITYLDADMFFYSDPKDVWDEIGDKPVAICPHNFPSWDAERLRGSGQYNVGWVTIGKDGLEHLNKWAQQVALKCDRETCGDQKYLDEWPSQLGDKLCVIQHRGADVAPWNIGRMRPIQYPLKDMVYINDEESEPPCGAPLVFYHFHEFKSPESRTGYKLRSSDIKLIYEPYEKAIELAQEEIDAARL